MCLRASLSWPEYAEPIVHKLPVDVSLLSTLLLRYLSLVFPVLGVYHSPHRNERGYHSRYQRHRNLRRQCDYCIPCRCYPTLPDGHPKYCKGEKDALRTDYGSPGVCPKPLVQASHCLLPNSLCHQGPCRRSGSDFAPC